ncbi:hypothetical protein GCM10022205_05130 [Spinactinospora alkalitolerans]
MVRTFLRRCTPSIPGLAHEALDPFVVDLIALLAQLGGDPRCPVGGVVVVDGADSGRQLGIPGSALRLRAPALLPALEGGACQSQDPAQPLDAVGVVVVGDETEAARGLISPAK